jgi:CheY-like chemotaxis protein
MALESVGGYEVWMCGAGPDALALAPSLCPDLVLLDVLMPDMDSPTTLLALRAMPECMNLPVVFLTASVQPADRALYRELGALDVIAKPFDPLLLPAIVAEIWADAYDTLADR